MMPYQFLITLDSCSFQHGTEHDWDDKDLAHAEELPETFEDAWSRWHMIIVVNAHGGMLSELNKEEYFEQLDPQTTLNV